METKALIKAAREQAGNMRLKGHYSWATKVDELATALMQERKRAEMAEKKLSEAHDLLREAADNEIKRLSDESRSRRMSGTSQLSCDERDALAARLAQERERADDLASDGRELVRRNSLLTSERDALAARLAEVERERDGADINTVDVVGDMVDMEAERDAALARADAAEQELAKLGPVETVTRFTPDGPPTMTIRRVAALVAEVRRAFESAHYEGFQDGKTGNTYSSYGKSKALANSQSITTALTTLAAQLKDMEESALIGRDNWQDAVEKLVEVEAQLQQERERMKELVAALTRADAAEQELAKLGPVETVTRFTPDGPPTMTIRRVLTGGAG